LHGVKEKGEEKGEKVGKEKEKIEMSLGAWNDPVPGNSNDHFPMATILVVKWRTKWECTKNHQMGRINGSKVPFSQDILGSTVRSNIIVPKWIKWGRREKKDTKQKRSRKKSPMDYWSS
jgi:hypothetical protein